MLLLESSLVLSLQTTMRCVLLRHGDKSNPLNDDTHLSLSANGLLQAQSLSYLVKHNQLPHPTHLYSSEINRSKETLRFLEEETHVPIHSKKEFDLQYSHENQKKFQERIQRGIHFIISHPPDSVLYVCSHQDWLYESTQLIPLNKNYPYEFWPTGRYLLFDIDTDKIWHLEKEGRLK